MRRQSSGSVKPCCVPAACLDIRFRSAAMSERLSMASSEASSMTLYERQRRPSYTYYKRHYAIRRKTRPTSVGSAAGSERRKPAAPAGAGAAAAAAGVVERRRPAPGSGRAAAAAPEPKPRRVSCVVQPNIAPRRKSSAYGAHPKLVRATWQGPYSLRLPPAAYCAGGSGGDTSDEDLTITKRKAATGEIEIEAEGGRRTLRSTCDWSEAAVNGEHLWMPTSASGDFCYVPDPDCSKTGSRMKCTACKIICHTGCIANLIDKVKFACKPTFRDVGIRQYRDNTATAHHWVHRRNQKGKCKHCAKSFMSKLSFSTKDIVAISCSWCRTTYHNKEPCFSMQRIEEQCSLGIHKDIIVPPSWIVKLPRRGSFKSSLRKSPKKRSSSRRKSRDWIDKDQTRAFAIKPIPTANVKPIIVFLNPKSGGNQGAKLMQKFQWLLNPRQVFDLTQGGPREGLEMYRKVPNLRVLACGGDGTVGWVLSVLDQMGFSPPPAIAVLPLGTGNDLARALGWGGGYTDEPISKILCNISEGEEQDLDRWEAIVTKNEDADPSEEGKDNLPLNVINNYFSLGVDAHIALEFHEAREARPDKFSSRLRNKMFYGQAGGKDLLQRRWKDLSEHVTIVCDDTDITHKLREHKVHAILFLNIPSYGGGTHPWAGRDQSTSDGLMEVIGLTTYQLPLLHAGGHGTSLGQCRKAVITTARTIPMQVDGEACRVNPSIITVSHLNRARMICKRRGEKTVLTDTPQEQLRIRINRITMSDYEQYHYDKETLMQHSMPLGVILVDHDSDLEQVRRHINRMQEENQHTTPLSPEWCFVDSCTAERFFRIDRAQEHLHFVTDISSEDVYVLDPMAVTSQVSATANNKDESGQSDLDAGPAEGRSSARAGSSASRRHSTPSVGSCASIATQSSRLGRRSCTSLVSGHVDISSLKERLFGAGASPTSHLLERSSEEILHAAQSGDLPRVKELHTSGVSLFSVSAMGQTALHLACSAGHKDVVRYLLANAPASAVNMRDNDKGHTALHCAALHGRRTICSMLVASGALLTLADSDGNTARQLALQADDKDLADYLESQEHFQLVVSDDHETAV
ncbi:diacylglycerol kinase zeta-like isoform X1 [Amphibalanus amphitrite]|uniref:diacylglycerol kinase zeta-like isoform X1 n=1 Tax=Amphibalanus amphitrite TaxID=1232801 RepID=UPI001C91210D|nr:diacylglycerol kinase zeta-like isoform X1 [Amphibalanus amphitrite]